MYSDKMAAAIKVNGKVLREQGETVYLPFGSEYSIFLKNLNSVRASVTITIDGESISPGSSFIIDPNSSVDIERYVLNGNLSEGNRFKFIERTSAIENHRGIKIDDGLVRIEYTFERQPQPQVPNIYSTLLRSHAGGISHGTADYIANPSNAMYSATMDSSFVSTASAGITAPGSISSQQFSVTSAIRSDGIYRTMVLRLLGEAEGKPVQKPIHTKTQAKCVSCGHNNKSSAKFCSQCGTGLIIV